MEEEAKEPRWAEVTLETPQWLHFTKRTAHSATLVGNKVVIFGGLDRGITTTISYVYILDLESYNWSSWSIPQGLDNRESFSLFSHSATLVDDLIVFIGGVIGEDGDRTDLVFGLDVVGKWFDVIATWGSPKRGAVAFHSATLMEARGEIIVYGGQSRTRQVVTDPLFALKTSSMEWRKMSWRGRAPPSRGNHGNCLVGNQLFIFSGFGRDLALLHDMHVLDLSWPVPTFSTINLEAAPRGRFGMIMFHRNGDLFLFGGKKMDAQGPAAGVRLNDMHRFSLKERKWTECREWMSNEQPSARSNNRAVQLSDQVMVFGDLLRKVLQIKFD